MSLKITPATANAALLGTGLKEQFTLGFLFLFAGAVPATAEEPLDMVAVHTQAVKISNASGATGLTFADPAAGILSKTAAETWSGVVDITGFQGALTTIAPTFYRLCAVGDDGRGTANATTGYRVQGTVGGPSAAADMNLATDTLADAAAPAIGTFRLRLQGS